MIKDKITPELKKRFLEELAISKKTGNERGFVLCIDEKENLTASKSCTGDHCSINLGNLRKTCPTGIAQGDFRTHPYLIHAKKELATEKRNIYSDKTIINHMQNRIRKLNEDNGVKGTTANSPSGSDLLYTLLYTHFGESKGTICTLSDIGDNKLECWTLKEMEKDKRDIYCAKAVSDMRKKYKESENIIIERWIDNIFNREIIDLNS